MTSFVNVSFIGSFSLFQDKVEFELEKLLAQQVHLEADLRGLSQSAVLQLTTAENEAEKLSSVIAFTAKLADGVAAKVKQLDLAKVRLHLIFATFCKFCLNVNNNLTKFTFSLARVKCSYEMC